MFNCFENPWGLIITAVITFIVLLIIRSYSPDKYRWWLWLLPAVLVFAAFGLDYLVESDSERIITVISTAVKAVENEDPDLLEQLIADNYSDSYHNTKIALMSHCSTMLSEPLFEKNIERIVSLDLHPPNATALLTVRVLFDKRSYVYQNFKQQLLVKVKMNLQKSPDKGWLISCVELLEFDFHPASWQFTGQTNY